MRHLILPTTTKSDLIPKTIIDPSIRKEELWGLSRKGLLHELLVSEEETGIDHVAAFQELVASVISQKEALLEGECRSKGAMEGRWLGFDPALTMYDEIAEEESSGFFDGDDVPPPEFWVYQQEGCIVSFVPKSYVDAANLGVSSNISDSLFWIEAEA